MFMRALNKFSALSLKSLAPSALVLGLAATSAGALTINDTFVTSGSCGVSGCVNFSVSGQTETAIIAATNQIASYYSNNVTINILFGANISIGNGAETRTGYYGNAYAAYTNRLTTNSAANPANTVLASAVANFTKGNGAAGTNTAGLPVVETSADLRANGRTTATALYDSNGNFVGSGGTIDGVVMLGIGASVATAVHEIDEVMGGGGPGSTLGAGNPQVPFNCSFTGSTKCLGGTDLYRYSANNTPAYNSTQPAYLSVNGGASAIAQFNNGGVMGDAGDFTTSPCLIQSWRVCGVSTDFNGVSYTVGSAEYQMMEALGWDPVPGPVVGAGLPGMALTVAVIGLFGWRRKRKPAAMAA
jgi:hypothetical protein